MAIPSESSPIIVSTPGSLWHPVYTKPRCEKVLRDYCQRHDILCYLPLVKRAQRYQRRTVKTYLPMFRSYVFVQLEHSMRTMLLESHKVLYIVPVTSEQENQLVRELRDIQTMVAAQEEAELIVLPELVAGTSVLITEGPLKGMTGIVLSRRNKTRVVVNVELLGQAVCADMDVGEIEPEKE